MPEEKLITTLTIAAPPERVFAVLADPATHAAIDGTGWVRDPVDPAPLTEVGQVFRMDMYFPSGTGGDYQMANKVTVCDPPRAIGWLPGQPGEDGELQFGGWTWRYDLAADGVSGTTVTLTYDWSAVPQFLRERIPFPAASPQHLANSLQHLAGLATKPAD